MFDTHLIRHSMSNVIHDVEKKIVLGDLGRKVVF